MIRSGIASSAFRSYTCEQIVTLACHAELEGVEWSGDVHVPHGDLETAFRVGSATRQAGLVVAAYGSYYKAGLSEIMGPTFRAVLDTAQALGAPLIRIWAGGMSVSESTREHRQAVADDLRRITALAEGAGVDLALEHARNTLTDRAEAAVDLLRSVDAGNLYLNWRPIPEDPPSVREEALGRFLPHLAQVHVFHAVSEGGKLKRLPLAEGKDSWRGYLEMLYGTGRDHFVLIESVQNDSTEQFLADVETLQAVLV